MSLSTGDSILCTCVSLKDVQLLLLSQLARQPKSDQTWSILLHLQVYNIMYHLYVQYSLLQCRRHFTSLPTSEFTYIYIEEVNFSSVQWL